MSKLNTLISAIKSGNEEAVIKLLRDSPRLMHAVNGDGWGAVHFCANENQIGILIRLVKEFNADVDQITNYGYTPLHIAIREKNIDCGIALLQLGADPSIEDRGHETAFDELHICLVPPQDDHNPGDSEHIAQYYIKALGAYSSAIEV